MRGIKARVLRAHAWVMGGGMNDDRLWAGDFVVEVERCTTMDCGHQEGSSYGS